MRITETRPNKGSFNQLRELTSAELRSLVDEGDEIAIDVLNERLAIEGFEP